MHACVCVCMIITDTTLQLDCQMTKAQGTYGWWCQVHALSIHSNHKKNWIKQRRLCGHTKTELASCSHSIVQELCESRGGRPGLSVVTSLLVSMDIKNY